MPPPTRCKRAWESWKPRRSACAIPSARHSKRLSRWLPSTPPPSRGFDSSPPSSQAVMAPDDIDLEAARLAPQISAALRAFGLDPSCVEDAYYGEMYDELQARLFAPAPRSGR